MTALPRSAEAASCSGRGDLVRRWAGHGTRVTFRAIPSHPWKSLARNPGQLDLIDTAHFTWEDGPEEDAALITTWRAEATRRAIRDRNY